MHTRTQSLPDTQHDTSTVWVHLSSFSLTSTNVVLPTIADLISALLCRYGGEIVGRTTLFIASYGVEKDAKRRFRCGSTSKPSAVTQIMQSGMHNIATYILNYNFIRPSNLGGRGYKRWHYVRYSGGLYWACVGQTTHNQVHGVDMVGICPCNHVHNSSARYCSFIIEYTVIAVTP